MNIVYIHAFYTVSLRWEDFFENFSWKSWLRKRNSSYSRFSLFERKALQKKQKILQIYRFVTSSEKRNILRLPELKFCSYLAKFTRNHGAVKWYTDSLWSTSSACEYGESRNCIDSWDALHEPPRVWLLPKIPRNAWSPNGVRSRWPRGVLAEQFSCSAVAPLQTEFDVKAVKPI